jgi:fascin 1/2
MSATGVDTLTWSFGLINSAGRYLTVETFGSRINCNGTSLKKKQIFVLEQDAAGKVYFKT